MFSGSGVKVCPRCHAPIIPKMKCGYCGYNPNAPQSPSCRNCGGDLNNLVLKEIRDDPDPNTKPQIWKCCAYCGWPIEQQPEPEPLLPTPTIQYANDWATHGRDSWTAGGVLEAIVSLVVFIFIVATLFPVLSNFAKTGFTPNANITTVTTTNSTGNSPSLGPIIQLFPIFFIFVGVIVVVKFIEKAGHGGI